MTRQNQTQRGINQMYNGMMKIARDGGYRERKELIDILHTSCWFDDFGYEHYQKRLTVANIVIERGLKNEDIPELMKEELEISDNE